MLLKTRIFINKFLYRIKNRHNYTKDINLFPVQRVKVGNMTYGGIYVEIAGNEGKLQIGNYCSIAKGVKFLVCVEHPLQHISTYPFRVMLLRNQCEAISKGDIIIEDDVWIGENAIILSGITVHQGAVIAAGAIVTKDVPPYAVVGGSPAKLIKFRFSNEIIKELLNIDYSKLTKEMVKKHADDLYTAVLSTEQIREMTWLPQKRKNDNCF